MISRNKICTVIICLFLLFSVLPLYGETLQGEADFMPWSGYWWPLEKGELLHGYRGRPSPIEKYDLYTRGYYPAAATQNAREAWYDPDVPGWYGICHGWANAAIMEHQDFHPSAAHNVFLAVGDKKGLLAVIHAEDETLYEYCRHPEPFHRYLLKYIGEQGSAVAADLDASEEFWSYPIYSYEMKIVHGVNEDQVQCRIKHADDQGSPPDFEGTVTVEKTYNYSLEKDVAGNYIMGGGSWQGSSVADHPGAVWIPIARRPERLFIDYDIVKEMALSTGDEYESLTLKPGHHLLIVKPDDNESFSITPPIGTTTTIKVALDRQSAISNDSHLLLKRGSEIIVDKELDSKLYAFEIVSETGNDNYEILLVPDKDNQTSCSIHLYVDYEAPFQHWFYGYPSSRYWVGSAAMLTSPGEIAIEIVGDQGLPSGEGYIEQISAHKQFLAVLPPTTADYFSYSQPMAVKISSTKPLNGLVFAGDDTHFWGSTKSMPDRSGKVVIPWLTSSTNWNTNSELYLAQLGSEDNQVSIDYYKDNGTFYQHREITLSANRVVKYKKGNYPGRVNLNGWALVNADLSGLDGAILHSIGKKLKDQLPLLALAREWLVPHIAVGDGWQTKISLYNPGDREIDVSLVCRSETLAGVDYLHKIQPFAHVEIILDGTLWGISEEEINGAWLSLSAESEFAGIMSFQYGDDAVASLPLLAMQSGASRDLPHLANDVDWWTGVVLLNRAKEAQNIQLTAYAKDGARLEGVSLTLTPQQKYSNVVGALFSTETMVRMSSLRLDRGNQVSAIAVFGTLTGGNRVSAFCW